MKKKFSSKWVGSKKPRKQRKYRAKAPVHIKRKMVSSNLSKDLRKRHGKRNFPLRKGDKVKIMKGEFKGKTGNVDKLSLKKLRAMVEGIFRTKKDGTKVSVYFDPSNLQIQELNLDDKNRKKALERKATPEKKKELQAKPLPKAEKKEDKKETKENK